LIYPRTTDLLGPAQGPTYTFGPLVPTNTHTHTHRDIYIYSSIITSKANIVEENPFNGPQNNNKQDQELKKMWYLK